jgi:hypothetical protein
MWDDVLQAAEAGDPAVAFERLRAASSESGLPYGAGGHAVVPNALLAGRSDPGETVRVLRVGAGDWVALRHPARPGASDDWRLGLVWLRLGNSRWLLEQCLGYLSGRSAGDVPLVHQQLVRGHLADVATDQMIVHTLLAGAGPADIAAAVDDLHDYLTRADRTLLRLLGASGFLSDGPGQSALLSELLADVYRDGTGDWP